MVYGMRAPEVAAYAAADSSLAKPISEHHPDIGAQVAYGVDHEGARTVADILLRRTVIGLTEDLGRSAARSTSEIMGNRLGWSEEQRAQAVRDYFVELHRRFVILQVDAQPPSEQLAEDSA